MKRFGMAAIALMIMTTSIMADTLVYEGSKGIGKGKHIVFIANDHEYRSEEACPALAKILAKRHGFRCTVLFGLDDNGAINREAPILRVSGKVSELPWIVLKIVEFRFLAEVKNILEFPSPQHGHGRGREIGVVLRENLVRPLTVAVHEGDEAGAIKPDNRFSG